MLSRWGDRVPLLHSTLKKLNEGVLTLDEAATALGINKTSVHNLRNRYGMAPGPLKPAKRSWAVQIVRKEDRPTDAGRNSRQENSKGSGGRSRDTTKNPAQTHQTSP